MGQIGAALAVVLAGLQARTGATDGFVTEQPEFAGHNLIDWSRFVLGGHEIRKTSYAVEARSLFAQSKTITAERLAELSPVLSDWDRNVRTGAVAEFGTSDRKPCEHCSAEDTSRKARRMPCSGSGSTWRSFGLSPAWSI